MKAVRINNAQWMATSPLIAEQVEKFCRRVKVNGLHGPNLFAYLAQVAQFGGTTQEFWVVFDNDDKPIAFAMWQVLGLPMVAKVYMPFLHSWEKKGTAARLLVDEYVKFGEKSNAVFYTYDPLTERHKVALERHLKRHGQTLTETGVINCTSKRAK